MTSDRGLPIPNPDWNNPKPYDGPTTEETAAFAKLQSAADGIRAWVTGAYLYRPGPDGWRAFGDKLRETADMCTKVSEDQARTISVDTPLGDPLPDRR